MNVTLVSVKSQRLNDNRVTSNTDGCYINCILGKEKKNRYFKLHDSYASNWKNNFTKYCFYYLIYFAMKILWVGSFIRGTFILIFFFFYRVQHECWKIIEKLSLVFRHTWKKKIPRWNVSHQYSWGKVVGNRISSEKSRLSMLQKCNQEFAEIQFWPTKNCGEIYKT